MTAMPIAAGILSTKKIGYAVVPAVDPYDLVRKMKEAVHFEVNVASELYWRGSQNDYSLKSDFGPLRLPYPTVWMEWSVPPEVVIEGKTMATKPFRVGGLLTEVPHEDGYRIGFVCTLAGTEAGSVAKVSPVALAFTVDDQGRYIDGQKGVSCYFNSDSLDKGTAEDYRVADMCHLHVACLALNLINCKNVTTEVAGHVPVRRSGAQKRRGQPKIEYRTICLPGSPSGGEATDENVGIMPLHRVRGHFKTFTPDAPLLGKCTGTYWWGWQVRGNKENGEIISDYKVTA